MHMQFLADGLQHDICCMAMGGDDYRHFAKFSVASRIFARVPASLPRAAFHTSLSGLAARVDAAPGASRSHFLVGSAEIINVEAADILPRHFTRRTSAVTS